MEIIKAPNPILNMVCTPADPTEVGTHRLALDMARKMLSAGGQGLAAPQVSVPIRLFVMKYGQEVLICFNPEITRRGRDKVIDVEGCLSIPGKRIRVSRSKICDLEFTELSGERRKLKLKGNDARCAQHEMDHLNGVLITEK